MIYMGRKPIYTSEKVITVNNIRQVIQKAMGTHIYNAGQIKYLKDYERNNQPILYRQKDVRPEINFRIVENHASEITSFKVGYVFGSPITYVQRAKNDSSNDDGKADDRNIALLNEMFFEENKASKDQQLARDFTVCGVGYRMILPKKNKTGVSPFDLIPMNPMTTFVIYSMDAYHKPMLAGSYYVDDDFIAHMGVYTDSQYFELEGNLTSEMDLVRTSINGIGAIPIIEYVNDYDRMGCFERVLPLLDALNNTTSDRLNGLAQFVQSFIWMNNVDLDSEQAEELKDKLILLTKNVDGTNQASVEYLTANLNQNDVQTLADYLYDQVLQIAGVPGREGNSGGDTGNAVMLRNGWQLAETAARSTEMIFSASERRLLDVALAIIRRSNGGMSGLKLSDIDIKFSRNRTDGLLVKTQGLANLLQSGIHPLKAIEVVGLFSDPQQVWRDSEEYMDKKKEEKMEINKDSGVEQQEVKEVTE